MPGPGQKHRTGPATMGIPNIPAHYRRRAAHPGLLACLAALGLIGLFFARDLLYDTWTLAAMPLLWPRHGHLFHLSAPGSGFDVTFSNYSVDQTSAAAQGYEDRVPAVLHHISLGDGAAVHARWMEVRQTCLDMHPGWQAYLWTDETADQLVRERFPGVYEMWKGYRYPIQRIDALRYMVLYHYGGVILDMDLQCKRSFGPLRRYEFVAPEAHPAGFSIGFMMAARENPFVGELVRNLPRYNRRWLGLPYPTVMFSTGCHYASTIHTLQPAHLRAKLKILSGPKTNPNMHRLNGPVSTPLFNHLGSSSWHAYDAAMIVALGKSAAARTWVLPVVGISAVGVAFCVVRRVRRRRRVLRG
ncbi:hypothetical protein VTJ49DRAFT_2652 [Mycothermus thermophilus]|uniref:Glycosyltransferase family 32 protein n=1 Tax=Humicola insolens TaxID=85995 RepID=A0ABR3V9F0_HUMIN